MTKDTAHCADPRVWMQINDSLQAYADAIDRGDIAALLALFTPDAVWDYGPELTCQGRDAMEAFFRERMRVWQRTSHHVGPPVVRVPDDTGAMESTAYFMATHLLHDGTRYTGFGRYVDAFVFTESGLLITRRRVVSHGAGDSKRPTHRLPRV